MKEPNYAPVYLALYPQLAEVARSHGYALAVHGSLGRDMDLICVPWVEQPSQPSEVVASIASKFAIRQVGEPDTTHHGRERRPISVGFGDCQIDLSFMPLRQAAAGPKRCGTCKHFETPWGTDANYGVCTIGTPDVPADGSGFCHLHEEVEK